MQQTYYSDMHQMNNYDGGNHLMTDGKSASYSKSNHVTSQGERA